MSINQNDKSPGTVAAVDGGVNQRGGEDRSHRVYRGSDAARIMVQNAGGDNLGALLDNVLLTSPTVTPPPAGGAPEPGTLALISLSLLGLGRVARRAR